MPEAAKAHTKAGAKAFVEHFWQVVNYAQATGDTDAIAAISVDGCSGCDAGIGAIDHIYDGGGRIRGGESTTSNLSCALANAADELLATVEVDVTNAPETDDYPGRSRDKTRSSTTVRDRLLLRANVAGWQVAQIAVVK